MQYPCDVAPIACAIAHHVPGRLRLKPLPGDGSATQAELCRRLMAIPAALSAISNPITGSIVFRYDRLAISPTLLCDAVRERGISLAVLPEDRASDPGLSRPLADAVANRVCEWVVESLALAAIAAAT